MADILHIRDYRPIVVSHGDGFGQAVVVILPVVRIERSPESKPKRMAGLKLKLEAMRRHQNNDGVE